MRRAKKWLGQHFLHDPNIICRIVDFGCVQPQEPLLEVGPGRGALTEQLLQRSGDVVAVEYDAELAGERLASLFLGYPQARLVVEDIRRLGPREMAAFGRRKVFGNLPYYLATHLILDYAEPEWIPLFSELIFMVQREAGARLWAQPRTKDYGYLSVVSQLAFEIQRGFRVPPGAFAPAPKVDSVVVKLIPRPERALEGPSWRLLHDLLKPAFGQRRKTILNSLKGTRFERPDVLEAAGVTPRARAEDIPVEQYALLARLFARHSIDESL